MVSEATKEVMRHFLYSKVEESGAVDAEGNVQEQEIVDLGNDCQITVAEAFELISLLED